MTRRSIVVALLAATPAFAVIQRLIPLKEVLASEQYIAVAMVETLDRNKPCVVLTVANDLKGKVPFRRLPVLLTGDGEAKKERHVPQLLDRLAEKQELVLFASTRGKRTTAFLYANGTWLRLTGVTADRPEATRFEFAHLEPYLRRTFKGTTDELKQAIIDGLSGKKAPPEPDARAEPGLGPTVKK